jgi:lysophospholipase L1-like esterase
VFNRLLTTATLLLPLIAQGQSHNGIAITSGAPAKFSFGQRGRKGFIQIAPGTAYDSARGYGFMQPPNLRQDRSSICADDPFRFSVNVPEGNYDVTFRPGDDRNQSSIGVKAEARRLLIEPLQLPGGKFVMRRFTINVRYKELASGRVVHLKKDEENDLDWDHRLTLEFNGSHPCVSEVELQKNDHAITVYLAGDSTVTDQRREPWAAWGQMLPRFFRPGVAIANDAESGESLKSFIGEQRLAKILETIKSGDYLFIQFAHNDQKPGPAHVDAFTTYKEYLGRYIGAAREKHAIPVLVTSMLRRKFDAQGRLVNTLEDYPDAMRQLAREQKVSLIDLNAMSKTLFETLGPEGTLKAFVHYPAHTFPGQQQELSDDTHFNSYGAYELARCVIERIRSNHLEIANYVDESVERFDPAHPDPPESWNLPPSPAWITQKSDGNR